MRRYFMYVFFGLILMAPQEWSTSMFKSSVTDFPFYFFFYALAFWAVMLSLMYGISLIVEKFLKNEGLELTLSAIAYMFVAFGIEWFLLGNSPWSNPGANQIGLVAGWVSVFILPKLFLDSGYKKLKISTFVWYVFFVVSVVVPVYFFQDGATKGVTIYGYTVIPFLFFTILYIVEKWRDSNQDGVPQSP